MAERKKDRGQERHRATDAVRMRMSAVAVARLSGITPRAEHSTHLFLSNRLLPAPSTSSHLSLAGEQILAARSA